MLGTLQTLTLSKENHVLRLTLARPKVKNAFNPEMIGELRAVFHELQNDSESRVLILQGEGGVFCSGGDLNWMQATLDFTPKENIRDAENLYSLFESMDACPIPIVAGIEGFALGGGVGLVSLCDYAIAVADAQFSLSEVKVGLIPACIGPFVQRKIGSSQARAMFLSSERFPASRAQQIGLIHEIAEDSQALLNALDRVAASIVSASPNAIRTTKAFLRNLGYMPWDEQGKSAVQTLADIRVTKEAQEGLRAFLEKRKPKWQ
jgi:methylglutaconyl-CoA hydratase